MLAPIFKTIRRLPVAQNLVRFATVACLLIGATMAHAQFDSASIEGSVTDPHGAVVANAQVNLRNVDLGTVLNRTTNSKGAYEFPDVQVGTYTVEIVAPGFDNSVTAPFNLVVGAHEKIDIPLKVGSASESVTVTVDNASLQTDSGEKSTTIENAEIIDLPLNGREYTDLALLVPGVQAGNLQDGTVQQRRGSFVVHGNRSSANNFLLDGLDNNSYQIANQGFNNQAVPEQVDAVQQYTVTTSNYGAEYGRASGAVVNVKTKGGTGQLHFTAFEYLRNTVFDAYGPFKGNGTKPALVQNQFGGSLGWRFPKVKDFFFFADYEGFRQATHTIAAATVPTEDQRNGTFFAPRSATDATLIPVPVQNPLTGKQYLNGVVPQSDWSPFALAVIQALPHPTQVSPTFGSNYISLPGGHNFRDIGDIRLDKYFGSRLQTFVRGSKQSIHITAPPSIPGDAGGNGFGKVRILTSSGVAGATVLLSPNSVLDARFGVTFAESGKLPYNQGVPNFYSRFNIPYPVDPSLAPAGLNTQDVLDFSGFGVESSQNQFSNPTTYNAKFNYTLAKGRHSINIGYEFLRLNEQISQGFPPQGVDSYEDEFSFLSVANRPASSVARRQAYGLTDFIFGARSEYELGLYTAPTAYWDFHYGYVTDTWRLFRNLTLNYGMRYEFSTPERGLNTQVGNFDPATKSLILSSSGSIANEALVNPRLDNVAPRFGFAYSFHPTIVLRGGYGISYLQWNRNGGEGELLNNYPNSITGDIHQDSIGVPQCSNNSQSLTCFRTTMQGYPTSMISLAQFSTQVAQTRYLPRANVTGYVQSYSLGLQMELDKSTIFQLGFVGEHGVHIRVFADYNQAANQAPGQSLSIDARRPISGFTDIYWATPQGFLRYDSLEAQLTHRLAGGLDLRNSFTWSKAFDNASADLEAGHGDSAYINAANPSYDSGISGYDQRLNDSLSLVWKIPFAHGIRNRALRQTADGWTLTSITRMTSGLPINVTYDPATADLDTDLGIAERPNYTGFLSTIALPRKGYIPTTAGYTNALNIAQVNVPTGSAAGGTNPFGNIPRNALTGPGYVNIDLGVQKNFRLPERMNLQFRCEAFDLLNHTNFKVPNADRSNGNFGIYVPGSASVFPSRQMQFGLRLSY